MNKPDAQVDRHLCYARICPGYDANLESGFINVWVSASVYGDPEESEDIAVVLDMTEVTGVTRQCAV